MEFLARFVGIWMVFVICIAVGVEGVAFGVTCSVDSDCGEANNKCDAGGTDNCICADDSFRRTSPAECVIKIVAGSACIAGDTCADTNAACDTTALECTCSSTYFKKNDNTCALQITNINTDTCDDAETNPDQCAVSDSECKDVSSSVQCRCKDTHYADSGACTIRIALTETCVTSPADNCIQNAECTSSTCTCKTGHFINKVGGCDPEVSALDGACDETDPAVGQCTHPNTECILDGTGKCQCKASTHYLAGTTCTDRILPEIACTAIGQCVTNAECVSSFCACDANYNPSPTTSPTMCSGVVKFASLSYMYVVPILVSMMFLLR